VAVFELGGALAPALLDLSIGPWRPAPELASFDAAAGRPESLWRVELARDDAASRAALARGARSIADTHAALDAAPRRLERALAAGAPPTPGAAAREPGRLERALLRAADLARACARVETRIEGALVARSLTTLSGDLEIWIAPGLSAARAELHARSIDVAARTRHAWARVLALILDCAGRFVALGISGSVAPLSMAWGLLRDLLREV
jgi:hypothetical protein